MLQYMWFCDFGIVEINYSNWTELMIVKQTF